MGDRLQFPCAALTSGIDRQRGRGREWEILAIFEGQPRGLSSW